MTSRRSFRPRARSFFLGVTDPATRARERRQVWAMERQEEARAALLRPVAPLRMPRTVIVEGEAFLVMWDGS